MNIARGVLAILWLSLAFPVAADEGLDRAIRQYRETLLQASPGELYVLMGEELFREKRGPKNASLEACDLGLGPGVVKGAAARMPRYFADSDKVEDLESRLRTCMTAVQGIAAAPIADFQKLASYVAAESNGLKLAPPMSHPKEIEAYRLGEVLFHRRAGSHDFACSTCHTLQGKRIRLQRLTNLVDPEDARQGITTWPAYRPVVGDVQTMQQWIGTCLYQARYPQVRFASEATIALQVYMGQPATGGVIATPGVKR